jgi:4-amino-4-deoxy-L-arabinose transferase-like glycosyltransferase
MARVNIHTLTEPTTQKSDAVREPSSPAERPAGPETPKTPKTPVLWLFLIGFGVLFAWNSWKRDFWSPDEARVALVARGMERGSWLVPYLGGEPYLDNPPLSYWLPAAFHQITRWDPLLSYRLPVVLAAVLGLFLTYQAGRLLFDGRIGFLAAVIQASTFFYYQQASWLDDDLLFAVSVQLALTSSILATRKGTSSRWKILAWIGLLGAALSKSVFLGLGLVLGPLVFFLFLEGGLAGLKRGFRRLSSWPGFTLFVLLGAPWYLFGALPNGAVFFKAHILGQHFERLANSQQDPEPPYYYLLSILWGFLPWSIFLPLGILHGKDRLHRDGERLSILWAIFTLAAMSFVSSKKAGYMLVVWPPLSLLISAALFETKEWFTLWEGFLRSGVFRVVPALLKVPLVLVLAVAVAYFGGYFQDLGDERLKQFFADRTAFLSCLGLAALAAAMDFVVSYRVRALTLQKALPRAAFELASAALFSFFAGTFFYQGLNELESSRATLERFAAKIPQGAPAAVYGRKRPEIYYYVDRPLERFSYPDPKAPEDPEALKLQKFLRQTEAVFLITSKDEFKKLELQFSSLLTLLKILDEGRGAWSHEYVLVGNK